MCLKLSTQGCFQVLRSVETILLLTLRRTILISSLQSIDACIYQTSVSSLVDFCKPLDGTPPGVIPARQGSKYDSAVAQFFPLCSLPFSLLWFSCFPVRTCTNFLSSGFKMSGNVVIRIALSMTSLPDSSASKWISYARYDLTVALPACSFQNSLCSTWESTSHFSHPKQVPAMKAMCVCQALFLRVKIMLLDYRSQQGAEGSQLWPLPTKLHTADQENVPASH